MSSKKNKNKNYLYHPFIFLLHSTALELLDLFFLSIKDCKNIY